MNNKKFIENLLLQNNKKKFILLPPPNLTGELHQGHFLNSVISDIISRASLLFKNSVKTFILPGFDHASLYNEIVARRMLNNSNNTKEEVLEQIYKNINNYSKKMKESFNKFGVLALWDYEAYTFSELSKIKVKETFDKLEKLNLIFKSKKICNYDEHLKTVLSNFEVQTVTCKKDSFDLIFKITECDNKDYLNKTYIVQTTKPETIYADMCLVCSFKHCDFKILTDKNTKLKIINIKNAPNLSVYGSDLVKTTTGNEIVKITPGFSSIDYEEWLKIQKNNFNKTDLIEINKKIITNLKFTKEDIIKQLTLNKSIKKIEKTISKKVINIRTKNEVTSKLIEQIFVNLPKICKTNFNKLNKLNVLPDNRKQMFVDYLLNISDWCISRQNIFGHYNKKFNFTYDTWFSSALWTEHFNKIIKKDDEISIITGKDILLFWIVKLQTICCELKYKICNEVQIHGLLCNKDGSKLSKSNLKKEDFNFSNFIQDSQNCDLLRMKILTLNIVQDNIFLNCDFEKEIRFRTKLINMKVLFEKIIKYPYNTNLILFEEKFNHINFKINYLVSLLKNINIKNINKYINEFYKFIIKQYCNEYLNYININNIFCNVEKFHLQFVKIKSLCSLIFPNSYKTIFNEELELEKLNIF